MESEVAEHALQAANVALNGRRTERTASRLASIQLRGIHEPPRSDRHHVMWEVAAVVSVALAAALFVSGVWFL